MTGRETQGILLDSYSLYASIDGKWKRLRRFDTRFGQIYLVLNGDFRHASLQHSGFFLDSQIARNPIGIGEPRHGWAAFSYDAKSYDPPKTPPRRFRLVVTEVSGHEEEFVHDMAGGKNDERDSLWGETVDAERNIDLTGWRIVLHEDLPLMVF